MAELALIELLSELGFQPVTAKGWMWGWQRSGRYSYRKCLVHLTNPDHLVASMPHSTDVSPWRIADRYANGRKHG